MTFEYDLAIAKIMDLLDKHTTAMEGLNKADQDLAMGLTMLATRVNDMDKRIKELEMK